MRVSLRPGNPPCARYGGLEKFSLSALGFRAVEYSCLGNGRSSLEIGLKVFGVVCLTVCGDLCGWNTFGFERWS